MQYSPKLKKAMEEIKKVISKYDVGAMVVLHTPGFSEYINRLDPSYSCIIQNGDEVRVRARAKEDFNGDKEARNQKIADTANMLHLLSEVGMRQGLAMSEVSQKVDQIVNAEHFGNGHSTNTEQNN